MAGIFSSSGGSAKVSNFVKEGKIVGVISEVILDEVFRHTKKFDSETWQIIPAPGEKIVKKYDKIVVDQGDSHVLASAEESKASLLVTLDKKHLLILKGKIKGLKILTPGELIKLLSSK